MILLIEILTQWMIMGMGPALLELKNDKCGSFYEKIFTYNIGVLNGDYKEIIKLHSA